MLPEHFHLLRPLWLLALPVGLVLVYSWWRYRQIRNSWQEICDPHLLKHLLVGEQQQLGKWPLYLLVACLVLATLALAGPTWEKNPQATFRGNTGRILILDLSLSMNSTDIKPSRLARARFKLRDLIQSGTGLQQGLIVFAGDAFVVSPLTDDYDTLLNLIPSLDTRTVPVQGSRPDLALKQVVDLFQQAGISRGDVILLTDGGDPQTVQAAAEIADQGFHLSIVAVGTSQGEPVPLPQGGLLKDQQGNIVIPSVDFAQLHQFAAAANGRIIPLSADDSDIITLTSLQRELEAAWNQAGQQNNNQSFLGDQWSDLGPWLILPLILLGSLGFRRGWLWVALILILPATPKQAHAFNWQDLWLRDDQQAAQALSKQDFAAAGESHDPAWSGAAAYKMEDYSSAIDAFSSQQDVTSLYNLGNAHAMNGNLDKAIEAYQSALRFDSEHEDAKFNLDLIQQLNQQQQQQNQSGQDQDDQNKQDQNAEREQSEANSTSSEDQQREEENQSQNGDSDESKSKDRAEQNQSVNDRPENSQTGESDVDASDNASTNASSQDAPGKQQDNETKSEKQQALEQWLRQIPDDPGGLLRRKFAQQYQYRKPVKQSQNW